MKDKEERKRTNYTFPFNTSYKKTLLILTDDLPNTLRSNPDDVASFSADLECAVLRPVPVGEPAHGLATLQVTGRGLLWLQVARHGSVGSGEGRGRRWSGGGGDSTCDPWAFTW